MLFIFIFLFLLGCSYLVFNHSSKYTYVIFTFTITILYAVFASYDSLTFFIMIFINIVIASLFLSKTLRELLFLSKVYCFYTKNIPPISQTEQNIIETGDIGWEKEFFAKKIEWKKLYNIDKSILSNEESIYIETVVTDFCKMLNDWEICNIKKNIDEQLWSFLASNKFFGLIIPKKYGGLEFSSWGHAMVLQKLYSHNIPAAISVAVPNSLGPAELIIKYGTDKQKDYYLPRLAAGKEIPCFALTGTYSGSDATSMIDYGDIIIKTINGEKKLYINLNFSKRYITLAPKATLIGLAFRLFDPDKLLSDNTDLGITLAIISSDLRGIKIGDYHFPLQTPFANGPIEGENVEINLDDIIGGRPMIGNGWKMISECLSVGRAISLPSGAINNAHVCLLSCTSYARIRQQFKLPIGYFEGIQEKISNIAVLNNILDSGYTLAISSIDNNIKSPIVSAMLKYFSTEKSREIINDAMDVHGGKAICMGEKNYLASKYFSAPISITVEGANILTRNLIIYGQGLVRCHPYLYDEIKSIKNKDKKMFTTLFESHLNYSLSNMIRCFLRAFFFKTNIFICKKNILKKGMVSLDRYTIAFSFLSDIILLIYGGKFKLKENMSARMADIQMYLFFYSSILYKIKDKALSSHEELLHNLSIDYIEQNINTAFKNIIGNIPNKLLRYLSSFIINPMGAKWVVLRDRNKRKLAKYLLSPSSLRSNMIKFADISPVGSSLSKLERVFLMSKKCSVIEKKLRNKYKTSRNDLNYKKMLSNALNDSMIDKKEHTMLTEYYVLIDDILCVDTFTEKF